MKKVYKKPLIMVEELNLDQPIAANCKADPYMMESLVAQGCFMADDTKRDCRAYPLYPGPNGVGLLEDTDGDGFGDDPVYGGDTICYHSAIQTAFLS